MTTDVASFEDALLKRDAARNGPDANCVDRHPVTFERLFRYSVGFEFAGRQFSFDLWTKDQDEAEAMLVALKETGQIEGQIVAEGQL